MFHFLLQAAQIFSGRVDLLFRESGMMVQDGRLTTQAQEDAMRGLSHDVAIFPPTF